MSIFYTHKKKWTWQNAPFTQFPCRPRKPLLRDFPPGEGGTNFWYRLQEGGVPKFYGDYEEVMHFLRAFFSKSTSPPPPQPEILNLYMQSDSDMIVHAVWFRYNCHYPVFAILSHCVTGRLQVQLAAIHAHCIIILASTQESTFVNQNHNTNGRNSVNMGDNNVTVTKTAPQSRILTEMCTKQHTYVLRPLAP